MESLTQFGQQTPLVIGAGGVVLKGNATLEAAKRLGWDSIAAIPFDKQTELVRGYKLVDNRSAELATWAQDILQDELKQLVEEGGDLGKLGWSPEDLAALEEGIPEKLESDATMLAKVGFIIGEPKTKLIHGQVVDLGRHKLIVVDPIKDVSVWREFIESDDMFCPYPGPYVANVVAGDERRMILVQPDVFIAGYIVDRFEEIRK